VFALALPRRTGHYALVIDAEQVVADLSSLEQQRLACDLANIVAPYGHVDPAVIDPGYFDQLLDRLDGLMANGHHEASLLAAECLSLIDRFDDEPDDAGFYALGALVSVYYASCALSGEADGGLNSVKRFLDLLGAADDDGESGLFDDAVRYLTAPSGALRTALVIRATANAASLE
jgi:hypothetical protein